MNATDDSKFLTQVRIATPCQARWEDMEGDERARFCRLCSKHVYNFSAMASADAAALIREKEGNLCGRFYQRADGTMLTADCPVGAARHWRRIKAFAGAAVATLVMTFTSIGMARQAEAEGREQERSRLAQLREAAVVRVKGWLGFKKPAPLMGGISARPAMLLGEVCIAGKISAPVVTTNRPPQK